MEAKKIYVAQYMNRLKIGVSNNVKKRMLQLSCGCPGIKCIYESERLMNSFEVEKELHNIFCEYAVGGEWFSFLDMNILNEYVNKAGIVKNGETVSIDYTDFQKKLDNFFNGTFSLNDISEKLEIIHNENEEMRNENEQIEKFTQAVCGFDIVNKYSDLIYCVLFGSDTVDLVKKYSPKRFESFRKYLSDKQNEKIDTLIKIITGLINMGWKYEDISKFVNEELFR